MSGSHCGTDTGKPEVMSWSVGFVPLNATPLGGSPRCVAVADCSDSARRRVPKQPFEIGYQPEGPLTAACSIACRTAYGKILLVG
jgi:hypothetical protein